MSLAGILYLWSLNSQNQGMTHMNHPKVVFAFLHMFFKGRLSQIHQHIRNHHTARKIRQLKLFAVPDKLVTCILAHSHLISNTPGTIHNCHLTAVFNYFNN